MQKTKALRRAAFAPLLDHDGSDIRFRLITMFIETRTRFRDKHNQMYELLLNYRHA